MIRIEDCDSQRRIIIDNKEHSFKKFVHTFIVNDTQALSERGSESKNISKEQKIVCYVPKKSNLEMHLYSGLPTKHLMNIPLAIDAPFALITSREEIELGSNAWNSYIRKEMYLAMAEVMEALKISERAGILRFIKYESTLQENAPVYTNNTFDCHFLNSFDFLNLIKGKEILPTYDKNIFVTPQSKSAFRFSAVVTFLFRKGLFGSIAPYQAIDCGGRDCETALNALGCKKQQFNQEYNILNQYTQAYIDDSAFRKSLYEYLKNVSSESLHSIRKWNIIPVYGKFPNETEYISLQDERIFVKKNAVTSNHGYYILNEQLLSKADCERLYQKNINEMDQNWENSNYNDELNNIIADTTESYRYIIAEFQKGAFEKHNSLGTLWTLKDRIHLKNQLGQMVRCTSLFVCTMPTGYFPTDLIRKITAHVECVPLAKYLNCKELSGIHYEDICYDSELTADDVESLQDDYFANRDEILRGFIRAGLLPLALIYQYKLFYLSMPYAENDDEIYPFPDNPVTNASALHAHMKKLLNNPVRIIKVKVEHTIDKGQNTDGTTFDLSVKDARDGVLSIYTPQDESQKCFCQMCLKVKPYKLIEVNHIKSSPKYYFSQLRIALCLECSKHFEQLRYNDKILDAFLTAISTTEITTQGHIDIQIREKQYIRFTATHLAEIQEILKQMPNC